MMIGLGDDEIAAMSPEERRELIRRLQTPHVLPRPSVVRLHRRIRLTLMTGGTIALIPWITYLGFTLPDDYTARNWTLTWVGFDILLVIMMATTAFLGWQRRPLVLLPAFGTGMLLLVDAWFDITTADSRDVWVSLAIAFGAELPLALLQIGGALLLFKFLAKSHPLARPEVSAWRVKLPL
ncbi:hypothetical protein [Nocardia arthritidis]|uniref:Uncharacterized protein n=1 Tax=Nocardia arthritidis TaxID=228602 RepID=A0A6G9YIU2_9NOCA|nr:hypothetical protein [Nocardia arthritidis]QIS13111.1 hypothetical protein F5544_26285 [Nocardia arthritidis]